MQIGQIVTLPNLLTLLRLLVLPLMAVAVEKGWGIIACNILIFAGITDILDGYIARARRQESVLGKLMDPVADKILVTVALLFLTSNSQIQLSPWIGTLILSREFLITGLRATASALGLVIGAGALGKMKTLFQMIGLGAIMLTDIDPLGLPAHTIGLICLWISIGLSYWSMSEYLINAYKELKKRGTKID